VFFCFSPLLHLLHLLHFPYLLVFTALTTLLPMLHFLLHSLHFLTCSPPVSCASRCRAARLRRAFQESGRVDSEPAVLPVVLPLMLFFFPTARKPGAPPPAARSTRPESGLERAACRYEAFCDKSKNVDLLQVGPAWRAIQPELKGGNRPFFGFPLFFKSEKKRLH